MRGCKEMLFIAKVILEIKRQREIKGVSQEKFYNDTNIHIGRIEASCTNVSINTLNEICKYLSINLSDFFKRVENNQEEPVEAK